ncbi:MAG: hypothetical protein HQK97_08375 [Nitrospirae bacterium]|nr:hypothetical protein [Nitrospirota bacterium]
MGRKDPLQKKKLVCPTPGCGNTGEATLEENQSPPHHGIHNLFDDKVLNVTEGFDCTRGTNATITCAKCGTVVYKP